MKNMTFLTLMFSASLLLVSTIHTAAKEPVISTARGDFMFNGAGVLGGLMVGTACSLINELTLRGNLRKVQQTMGTLREDMDYVHSLFFPTQGSVENKAFTESRFLKDRELLAQQAKFSVVRRSLPFRAFVFAAPSVVACNIIQDNPKLKEAVGSRIDYVAQADLGSKAIQALKTVVALVSLRDLA